MYGKFLICSRAPYRHLTDNSRTLTDFHGKFLIFSGTPHGRSRTFTDEFGFSHGHLMNAHGLLRTILDFLTDTSRTLTDLYGKFLICSRTPHGQLTDVCVQFSIYPRTPHECSRTFTDFHGLILIFPRTPCGCLRTFSDISRFSHGHLTDATDFHGRILFSPRTPHRQFSIPPRTPYGRSRTLTKNFRFSLGHLTDAHGLIRTIFLFSHGNLTDIFTFR